MPGVAAVSLLDAEQAPFAGNAFDGVITEIFELDARSRGEVRGDTRHDQLARGCSRAHTLGDMDGDSRDVVTTVFDFTSVKPDPDVYVKQGGGTPDCVRTADGAGRAHEGSQKAIAGRSNLPSTKSVEVLVAKLVELIEDLAPPTVSSPSSSLSRLDDIGKHDRGKHPVEFGQFSRASEELLYLTKDGSGVAKEAKVVGSRDVDELRVRYVLGQIAGVGFSSHNIVAAEEDQRGGVHLRQKVTHVRGDV